MATDLAEFLGAAIGFHLLVGIGCCSAAFVTAVAAFLILGLQRFGFRPFEATIVVLVVVIGAVLRRRALLRPIRTTARSPTTPSYPAFQGCGVGAARGRDPRRDGDAARDLPALGADAGPDPARDATRRRSS